MNQKNPNICLAHTLRRADRVVSQLYNEYLAPVGLRVTQFTILRTLALTGTTTASQIRTTLVMDQTTVSRALKPLIRDGYITVGEGATRREKALSLSAQGKKLYEKALVPWGEAQEMLRKKLAGGQEDILIQLSREIVAMKD